MGYTTRLVAVPGLIDGKVFDAIFALDRATFPDDEEVCIRQAYWWLVRDEKGEAIGFCGAEKLGEDAIVLSRVGLLEHHRGQGIQKKCISVREAFARKRGLDHIVTYTSYENLPSINNLIKCGYTVYRPSVLHKWLHFYKCLNPRLTKEEIRAWQKKCDLGYS